MVYFPKNIIDLIFSFDNTYHNIFKSVLDFFNQYKINEKKLIIDTTRPIDGRKIHFEYPLDNNKTLFFWLFKSHLEVIF